MQGLEKILEEINEEIKSSIAYSSVFTDGLCRARNIIRKHMNDGWISVEKELPPFGKRLQATILHHEWISDYDSSWVPEEEKIHHPAYTEVCEIYPMEGMWFYTCKEDNYERDIAYINPLKDLGNPISEIIAWRFLPDSYRPEEKEE